MDKKFYGWVLGAMLMTSTLTQAAGLSGFIKLGESDYDRPDTGLWHQEAGGYPTAWDMKEKAIRLGLEYGNTYFGVRGSYAHYGKYNIHAEATSNEDCANFTGPFAYSYCGGVVSKFMTSGSMQAYLLTGIARTPELFGIRATVEAGFAIRGEQTLKIYVESPDGSTYHYKERRRGTGRFASLGLDYKDTCGINREVYWSNESPNFNNTVFPSGVTYVKAWMVNCQAKF